MEPGTLLDFYQGKEVAFRIIFNNYYKGIVSFILSYRIDVAEAEDIAQDLFIKLWQKRPLFRNELAFKSYIYRSARHAVLNSLEHKCVRDRSITEIQTNSQSEDFFYQNYIENETNRILLNKINQLPPRSREIMLLSLDNLSNKEIAGKLSISVYTVKNHKASALKFLKDNLKTGNCNREII